MLKFFYRLKRRGGAVLFAVIAIMSLLIAMAITAYFTARSSYNTVVSNYDFSQTYLSAISVGEIYKGIARLESSDPRRVVLLDWLESIRSQFSSRILPFDEETSMSWGELVGNALRTGHPKPLVDAQIAATALRHGMTLVTRNVRDMTDFGVELFNPFDE